jgi:tetratricopeptide (TPR) repeat protein
MNETKQGPNFSDATNSTEYSSSPHTEVEVLLEKGIEALADGGTLSALYCFEKALNIDNRPNIRSYFAFCIAKERGQINRAISLCEEALSKEPKNTVHYLNLGRIYLLSNKRADAIKIFREGLKQGENQQIIDGLVGLGTRKTPVIPFLKRNNPINKYLGIAFNKLRLR